MIDKGGAGCMIGRLGWMTNMLARQTKTSGSEVISALHTRPHQSPNIRMKTIRHITRTQWAVLLALFGFLLTGPSLVQAGKLSSGISGQTFVHDSRVFSFPTGQPGINSPFYASLRVYAAGSGRLVTTITTDSAGRFQVSLRPGNYQVVPDTMAQGRVLGPGEIVIGSYETAAPVSIRVPPHRFAPLTITYERAMGL